MKFEDGSVKQNILIPFTGLALALFSFLKWSFKKNQGRFHGRRTVFFLCVFVLGNFKEEMVSFEGFSVFSTSSSEHAQTCTKLNMHLHGACIAHSHIGNFLRILLKIQKKKILHRFKNKIRNLD